MSARATAALAAIVLFVVPLSYHLATATRVASEVTASFGFTVKHAKQLNILPLDAPAALVKTRILRGAEAAEVAKKAGISKPLAVQEFQLPGGKKIYVVILRGNQLRLKLIDSNGAEVRYRLQRLQSLAKTAALHKEASNPVLVDVEPGVLEHAYMPLKAYKELTIVKAYKATSYKLEALIGGRYVLLGYYITPSAYYAFYLGGHLVYKVVAEGRFYVNPGHAVVLVADKSHYVVNPPFSNCSFHVKTIKTSIAITLRADGTAALLDCPVTTKLHGWALVTVDKYGGIDTDGNGSKWIAFGCGCNAWSP